MKIVFCLFLSLISISFLAQAAEEDGYLAAPFKCYNVLGSPSSRQVDLGRVNFRGERRLSVYDQFGRVIDVVYVECAQDPDHYVCNWGTNRQLDVDLSTLEDQGEVYTADAKIEVQPRLGNTLLRCFFSKN